MIKAAGVLLNAPSGLTLFLKRSDKGDHAGEWCLPAGKIEENETEEQAARRETKEETGFDIESAMKLVDQEELGDVFFTTFSAQVPDHFIPVLDEEHTAYAWAQRNDPPLPLHPGVKKTLSELAMDEDSVRDKDLDGRLHVRVTNISKANVCPYRGQEIPDSDKLGLDPEKIYQLLRSPEELEKAASTSNNIQLLSEHIPVTADDHQSEFTIGSTGTDAAFVDPYLQNSIVVWAGSDIEDIENEIKKELSSAYRYRADMTPGVFKGVAYDGVMRDIVFNHVALVKKGRAGSDVVVGDSIEELDEMPKKLLSRKAVMAMGALTAFLVPRLAMDAKLDSMEPLLKGITAKNFKEKTPDLVKAINKLVEGKLAQDETIGDVVQLLEALDNVKPMEATDDANLDPNSGVPVVDAEEDDDEAMDADPMEKAKGFFKGKVSEDVMKAFDAFCAGGKAQDAEETEEEKKARAAKDADMVKKPAMDAAIKVAVEDVKKNQKDIRTAERKVRPWVGDLSMAFDSADDVYKAALETLGVKIAGIHPSAYPTILEMQKKPGERDRSALAMDTEVDSTAFAARFPDADRIKSL